MIKYIVAALCLLSSMAPVLGASYNLAINYKLADPDVACDEEQRKVLSEISRLCSAKITDPNNEGWTEYDTAEVKAVSLSSTSGSTLTLTSTKFNNRALELEEAQEAEEDLMPTDQGERALHCEFQMLCERGAYFYCNYCSCCNRWRRRSLRVTANSERHLNEVKTDIEACAAKQLASATNLKCVESTAIVDAVSN